MIGPLRRLFGMDVPRGVASGLGAQEVVLATAGELVATSLGLWMPDGEGYRRVGWHLVDKAVWHQGELTVTVAREVGWESGIVLLADLPPRSFPVARPGKLPAVVRKKVAGAVVSSHYRELPGGGARLVQRRVPGASRVLLQLRPDPGTDQDAVRELATQVSRGLGGPPPG